MPSTAVIGIFAVGKDQGIDIRRHLADEVHIVQCKHYLRTGLPGLRRDLRAEAKKVRALRPDSLYLRYVSPLTPNNKEEISTISELTCYVFRRTGSG